jgi:hypothetical protein
MEHEHGTFKMNRGFGPWAFKRRYEIVNLRPDWPSNPQNRVPKICAGNLDISGICLQTNHFASKANIFLAQILGGSAPLLVGCAKFLNEAIQLPHRCTVAWFLRFR